MTRGIPSGNSLFEEVLFRLTWHSSYSGPKTDATKTSCYSYAQIPSQFRIQTSSELHLHCIFNSKEGENTLNR